MRTVEREFKNASVEWGFERASLSQQKNPKSCVAHGIRAGEAFRSLGEYHMVADRHIAARIRAGKARRSRSQVYRSRNQGRRGMSLTESMAERCIQAYRCLNQGRRSMSLTESGLERHVAHRIRAGDACRSQNQHRRCLSLPAFERGFGGQFQGRVKIPVRIPVKVESRLN